MKTSELDRVKATMTREQRKRRRAQVLRVLICIGVLLMLIGLFGQAAEAETPVSGREYLTSMGVPAEQQEHIFGVICDVHC